MVEADEGFKRIILFFQFFRCIHQNRHKLVIIDTPEFFRIVTRLIHRFRYNLFQFLRYEPYGMYSFGRNYERSTLKL